VGRSRGSPSRARVSQQQGGRSQTGWRARSDAIDCVYGTDLPAVRMNLDEAGGPRRSSSAWWLEPARTSQDSDPSITVRSPPPEARVERGRARWPACIQTGPVARVQQTAWAWREPQAGEHRSDRARRTERATALGPASHVRAESPPSTRRLRWSAQQGQSMLGDPWSSVGKARSESRL